MLLKYLKEKIKITEMCVPTNGELCSSDTACSGDIVILPNDVLQLNSILGNEMLLPQRTFIENPLPMLQTTIAVKKSEQREILLGGTYRNFRWRPSFKILCGYYNA